MHTSGLSILIPTYGYSCYRLVEALQQQCQEQPDLLYEIFVLDDGANREEANVQNNKINELSHCRFIAYHDNVGKSKLLNRASKETSYSHLLFIDSDAEVCSQDFIRRYVHSWHEAQVVCGGLITSEQYSRPDNQLRYRYECAASQSIRLPEYLNQRPYHHFTTFNVLVEKEVLERIPFNESFVSYGYEDTFWGMELLHHAITLCHIHNPLVHTGIESNENFLRKTERALQNLSVMPKEFQQFVTLSRNAQRLSRLGLALFIRCFFRMSSTVLRRQLLSHYPSLFCFKIYKLGYYLTVSHRVGIQ